VTASARTGGLASATRFLVFALSALYVTAAVAGALWIDFDGALNLVLFVLVLCAGSALMLAGQLLVSSPSRLYATLVSVGAIAGGLPLIPTIVAPIAAATVMACAIALARSRSTPAA
jgi:hypothetical protein